MTEKEVKRLLQLAVANFPAMQEKELGPTAYLWQKMLSDMPYELAEKSLFKVLTTARFFPTVAEIRQAGVDLTQPQQLSANEAWGEIKKAISKFGYYREKEAMESMPLPVVKIAKRFGWREICISEEPEVIRAQFRMAWDSQSKSDKEMAVLPSGLKQMIEGVGEVKKIEGE